MTRSRPLRVRSSLLALLLGFATIAPARSGEPVPSAAEAAATRVRAAASAKDDAALRSIAADDALDPFLVVQALFAMQAAALAGSTHDPSFAEASSSSKDMLDAAEAFAKHAVGYRGYESVLEHVRRRRAATPEELAKEAPLLDALRRLRAAVAAGDEAAVRALVAERRAQAAAPGADLTSLTLASELARAADAQGDGGGLDAWAAIAEPAGVAGWRRLEASARWHEAMELVDLGRHDRARTVRGLERTARLAMGDATGAARALEGMAKSSSALGDLGRAEGEFQAAKAEYAGAADRAGAARSDVGLATLDAARGRYAQAVDALERAAAEQAALHATVDEAETHASLAALFHTMRDAPRALEAQQRSVALTRASGDASALARRLHELALALLRAGRHADALATAEDALVQARASGDRLTPPHLEALCGTIQLQAGDAKGAVPRYERAIERFDAVGAIADAARTRLMLGEAYLALARLDDAKAAMTLAVERLRGTDDRRGLALALEHFGQLYRERRQLDEARPLYQQALAEWEALGDREGQASAYEGLASVDGDAGARPMKAIREARRAIEIRLDLGAGLGDRDAEGGLAKTHATIDVGVYAAWSSFRTQAGRRDAAAADAFWFIESGRAILLAESLADRGSFLATRAPADLLAAEAAARARVRDGMATLRDRLAGPDAARTKASREALDANYRELDDTVARIQREARRTADVAFPRPRALDELRAALPAATACVLYQCGAGLVTALVVRKDRVALEQLAAQEPVEADVEAYLRLDGRDAPREEELASRLYDRLLRPLEASLEGTSRLVVVPDGALHLLPFGTLSRRDGAGATRAVDRWELADVPSASVYLALLDDLRGVTPGVGLVALGDPVYPGESGGRPPPLLASRGAEFPDLSKLPRLPATNDEARGIAALVRAEERTVLLREKATVTGVKEALAAGAGRRRAVHLACHGYLDLERPRLTGLVLSGGEILTADDIYRLDVPADLVVLSACETGRGKLVRGEGVAGLVRAFVFAGAPRVIVSLWKVDDRATRLLMQRFYEGWLTRGLGAAAALRDAQRAVRDHEERQIDPEASRAAGHDVYAARRPFAAPRFWGAWTLWGVAD